MKLLSHTSREYKGTKYQKFWVVISNKLIEKLSWKKGEELKAKVEKNKLIIEKN
jgi:hypothetical protein